MGKITLAIVEFFTARKSLFYVLLLSILGVLGLGVSKLRVNQNIFAAMPKGKIFEQFNRLIESNKLSNSIVFSVAADSVEDGEIEDMLGQLCDTITKSSKGNLIDVVGVRPNLEETVVDYFYNAFPYLIDSGYYKQIDSQITTAKIRESMKVTYNQFVSPGSSFLKKFVERDPIYISGPFFLKIKDDLKNDNFVIQDGITYTKDKKEVLITAHTTFDAGNSAKNIELLDILKGVEKGWNTSHPKVKMSFFGTFEIAAENAIQVKKDNHLTITITVIAILLVLTFYYRKLLIPVYFFLPTLFGALFSLGIVGFIKPEISAISLATSAVLLGIIVDYAFHFFTHLKHTKSIDQTIKDISVPLFTGSFTTITALAALKFSNSPVLQDFGTISALSLTAAAAFTLIGLPIILKTLKFDYSNIRDEKVIESRPSIFAKKQGWYLIAVVVLTTVLYNFSGRVKFDSNLESMSFHSDQLKDAENKLTNVDPDNEKRIYVFAGNANRETARMANFNLYTKLLELKSKKEIKYFNNSAPFLVPEKLKNERLATWNHYWGGRLNTLSTEIKQQSNTYGLKFEAFHGFFDWLQKPTVTTCEQELLTNTGVDNLVNESDTSNNYITTLVVSNSKLDAVKKTLAALPNVEVFDRGEIAMSQLTMVKDDFNYLFWITASIVFATMLLIYGRLELTFMAFMPMAVSWTWILGIAGIAGIQFNFVNVIISTFVFGLGDDFSIFVTDGLLSKYRFRNNNGSSYTSAIVLSATATLIGLGVLFFAKHPAIHSIAAISVLGIGCILFLSLTFQPILFNYFIFKRIDKNQPPLTFVELFWSVSGFAFFIGLCLSFYLVIPIIAILPVSRATKTKYVTGFISTFSKIAIYSDQHIKKRIFGKEHLDLSTPKILIANHTSFLDILLMLMLNPKIIMMVNSWVYKSPLFGFFIRYAGFIYSETGPEENLELIKKRISEGYSILIFPEGTRSTTDKIQRFHKGAFYLSKELSLDIQPILIHGAHRVLPKNDYIIKWGSVDLKILPAIKANDASWGNTYQERCKSILAYFRAQYKQFKSDMEDVDYLKHRVLRNYLYKGPVVEWYTRVKWNLEKKNFAYYDQTIGERKKILDLGCGYGYLDFYLQYRNDERAVTAIDYDDEKIAIASNCFDKTDKLQFIEGNITDFEPSVYDAIFINDVLHYLPNTQQSEVLQKCADNLAENGIIFIRDGVTDDGAGHKNTQLTEYLSTKIFKFNKQEHNLEFPSIEFIRKFATDRGFSFEMQRHSEKTSNVLFILRK